MSPAQQPQPHNAPTVRVTSNNFSAGFQRASIDFELQYKPRIPTFDAIQITTIFLPIASGPHSDLWKAGYQAGRFAALCGIPSTWTVGPLTNDVQYGMNALRRRAS